MTSTRLQKTFYFLYFYNDKQFNLISCICINNNNQSTFEWYTEKKCYLWFSHKSIFLECRFKFSFAILRIFMFITTSHLYSNWRYIEHVIVSIHLFCYLFFVFSYKKVTNFDDNGELPCGNCILLFSLWTLEKKRTKKESIRIYGEVSIAKKKKKEIAMKEKTNSQSEYQIINHNDLYILYSFAILRKLSKCECMCLSVLRVYNAICKFVDLLLSLMFVFNHFRFNFCCDSFWGFNAIEIDIVFLLMMQGSY